MVNNKIQFGVVREDPQVEIDVVLKYSLKSAVLIGSGGCTAFSLKTRFPNIKLSLIEPNPEQIKLIKKKIKVLKGKTLVDARKIMATGKESSLIESGNFESLFKMFREFIYEFIIAEKDLLSLFKSNSHEKWRLVFKNPYWSTAFDLFFSDSLLVSMFGRDAVQYAPKNSYAKYFKTIIEKGVLRRDARHNYFLHHIFFGYYLSEAKSMPLYLQKRAANLSMSFSPCFAHEFEEFKDFDLVSLSNILDWSSPAMTRNVAKVVSGSMVPGSVLLFRQLNNKSNFKKLFKKFKWQTKIEKSALNNDRSLFYSKICIGVKI